jgi:hypothetical protein
VEASLAVPLSVEFQSFILRSAWSANLTEEHLGALEKMPSSDRIWPVPLSVIAEPHRIIGSGKKRPRIPIVERV